MIQVLMRRMWRRLLRPRRPGEAQLVHVRSHTHQFPLADRGATGTQTSSVHAHRWLAKWVGNAQKRVRDEAIGNREAH